MQVWNFIEVRILVFALDPVSFTLDVLGRPRYLYILSRVEIRL